MRHHAVVGGGRYRERRSGVRNGATTGLKHCSKQHHYSISSFARVACEHWPPIAAPMTVKTKLTRSGPAHRCASSVSVRVIR